MLRWMCGKTRHDKIRNDNIRKIFGITPIVKKMVETRLKSFEHAEKRHVDYVVKRVDEDLKKL